MDGDNKVKIRSLQTGPSDESSTVITSGLTQGERVVLEGTDRLRDGSEVEVVNDSKDVPATPAGEMKGKRSKDSSDSAKAGKAEKGSV
jgi:multidrug efflux system membrane fusion protein